jgi:DNA (cytosine-5)-methyltransferase 1
MAAAYATVGDVTGSLLTEVRAPARGQVQSAAQRTGAPAFRFVDLFAGIGGIRLGLEKTGGECVYSVEIDKHARMTYACNFGPVDHDDVRTLTTKFLPAFDLLAAGFPCQPFSIAGVSKKNSLGRPHGFADEVSGNLFFAIRDVLRATRPRAVLLENVKNLLTHDSGRTWARIEKELSDLGYLVARDVIDSSRWVPQRRRRTFIVCLHDTAFDAKFVFPPIPPGDGPTVGSILEPADDVPPKYTLTPALWNYLEQYAASHRTRGNGFGRGLVTSRDAVTRTLSARYYKDGSEILLQLDGAARPRMLTPVECALLMGFPSPRRVAPIDDDPVEDPPLTSFRIPVSDKQAYRQFGNSVAVPVVEHLGAALAKLLRPSQALSSAANLGPGGAPHVPIEALDTA